VLVVRLVGLAVRRVSVSIRCRLILPGRVIRAVQTSRLEVLVAVVAAAVALQEETAPAPFRVLAVQEPLIRLPAALLRELAVAVVGQPQPVRPEGLAEPAAVGMAGLPETLGVTEQLTPAVVAAEEPTCRTAATVDPVLSS
jgi:hypothetical protein